MNKLISRNPILRFKLERKITKFYDGGIPNDKYVGGGTKIVNLLDKLFKGWNPYTGVLGNNKSTSSTPKTTPKSQTTTASKTLKKVSRTNVFPEEIDKNYTHNFLEALRAGYRPNRDGTWKEPTTSSSTSTDTPTNTSTTYVKKLPVNWNKKYNDFKNNLTTALKAWLTNLGVKYDNVKALQEFLNNKGFGNRGTQGLDGKWGNKSLEAWNKFAASIDFTPKVNINPVLIEKDRQTIMNLVLPKPELPTIPEGGISNFTPLPTTKTYNRTDVRDFIRSKGRGAYDFTGALRRALRMVLNGQGTDEDRAIVQGMNLFKTGGQLPSRNIVERFKLKIKK